MSAGRIYNNLNGDSKPLRMVLVSERTTLAKIVTTEGNLFIGKRPGDY